MTKYNLEEFKAWLEADPTRKENLPENAEGDSASWNRVFMLMRITEGNFDRFLINRFATREEYNPYRQVALKWAAEVDTRERERERESTKWGGIN